MKTDAEHFIENIEFALKNIADVAQERQNIGAYTSCEEMKLIMKNINRRHSSEEDDTDMKRLLIDIRTVARQLASELLAAVKFEWREVVIPFIEVKRPTHEFGLHMFPDYFQWLSQEKEYAPEELVGILEEQTRKLSIAIEHLDK